MQLLPWLRFSEGLLLTEWQPFSMIQNGPCFHAVPSCSCLCRGELDEAMTWLAWYAPGIYTAVLDYMDTINGELIPSRM